MTFMTFINSSPNRRIRSLTKGNSSSNSNSRNSTPTAFVGSLGKFVKPLTLLELNPNLNLEISIGSGDKKSSPPPSESKKRPRSGNRPHKSSGYYPLKDRKTISLSFNSGIRSGLVVNDKERTDSNYSNLFVLCGSLFPENNSNSVAEYYFLKDIYQDISRDAQEAINFRISKDLTRERLFLYIRKLINALQLYYYVDSVTAYCNGSLLKKKNTGLMHLRDMLDFDVLSQQAKLQHRLQGCPVPPNLISFIRYMYQNFTLSDEDGCTIVRLGFRDTIHEGEHVGISPDYYEVIIDELFESSVEIAAILSKTYPNMNFDEPPLSSELPIFDKNFLAFWTNSCTTHLSKDGSKVIRSRTVKNANSKLNYFTFNGEDLDGIFVGCNSMYSNDDECYYSGVWAPFSDITRFRTFSDDNKSSLLTYNEELGRMTTPYSLSSLSQSGLYHSFYYNSVDSSFVDTVMAPIGCVKYQSASLSSFRQSTDETINNLFHAQQLKSKALNIRNKTD